MPANPLKGEVELVSGGTAYILVYTTNAIATVEDLADKSIGEITTGAALNSNVGEVRTLLYGALLSKHPDGLDLLKVGDIMDDYEGPLSEIVEKIGRAIRFRLSRTPIDAPFEPPKLDDAG